MFQKILIANRGEIAVRIARTARRMGIRTVAVYSDADADALHVAVCDEAYRLGPPAPRESYLCGDRILQIAQQSGAQAIHPGYGFLSENEDFALACQAAGVVFIGPPAAAIRAMGSKSEAKRLMAEAGVPLVPGFHGVEQDPQYLLAEAQKIGFPVLIKASAGGGGKGMKIVAAPQEFLPQLESAKREAKASFSDDQVLLERYLQQPRHIEIQVFADQMGQVVYLFERDCSVQRRHQKVVEEAPAPGMTTDRRAAMGEAAIKAAQKVGYVGAGTVEFIAEPDGRFYFMEMNTRLQVEHPVTEMITGLDLVEWQLRVAAGQPLPKTQAELQIHGHALEARIYAEDPQKDFLPAIGRIQCCVPPQLNAQVRLDTGVRAGDAITPYYDPMIAKLVVWGENRAAALRQLSQALAEYRLTGLTTNLSFLQRLVSHPAFAAGEVDTGFIGRYEKALLPQTLPVPEVVYAFSALAELAQEQSMTLPAHTVGDSFSPWLNRNGWWLNQDNHRTVTFQDMQHTEAPPAFHSVTVHYQDQEVWVEVPSGRHLAQLERIDLSTDGQPLSRWAFYWCGERQFFDWVKNGTERTIFYQEQMFRLAWVNPALSGIEEEAATGHLHAPMPGTVVKIMTRIGELVEAGQPLLVLEAMKMEHVIRAPFAGTVRQLFYQAGEQVSDGAELLDLAKSDG